MLYFQFKPLFAKHLKKNLQVRNERGSSIDVFEPI